jgi:hypothetical protein
MRDAAQFDQLRTRNHIDHHEISTAITRGAQQEVDGRKQQISQGGGCCKDAELAVPWGQVSLAHQAGLHLQSHHHNKRSH